MKLRIRYNAPVVLTFAIVAALVLLIDQISGGVFIRTFFTLYPDFNAANPLSWLRMFTYVIGHANWNHLISNFSFILLIGPVLEEKYGSVPLLLMMLVTALATAILNILLVHTGLYGASGIVFMLILLSSFTNIRQGEIPVTFILIIALYLVREFVNALAPSTVSQLAHIVGGIIGGLFGFIVSRSEKTPGAGQSLPAGQPKDKERNKE
ncbi:MAG TPA: rhomboid family intramembrane serine protease [Spirochaetia bacterium]|nr:rhomboid family intramembrane serine protease [Spirochaetia bacterium]